MNPMTYHPYMNSNTAYIKRTEVPFFSDRLNKRIENQSYFSRLIDYLLSKDEKNLEFALNSLLTKSYQEKLLFSFSIEKDFSESVYPTPTILDSLLNTIIYFKKINNNENENNNEEKYKLIFNKDMSKISKVISIIRNSTLLKPNDQYLANNPTVVLLLLEIGTAYLSLRKSISVKQNSFDSEFNPFKTTKSNCVPSTINTLNPSTSRYIIEIFSKIVQHLSLQPSALAYSLQSSLQNSSTTTPIVSSPSTFPENSNTGSTTLLELNNEGIFIKNQLKELSFGELSFSLLKSLPASFLTKKLFSLLEMSIYCFDDDDELLACIETIEYLCKAKRNRLPLDENLLKPIYDQFIIPVQPTPFTTTPTNNENLDSIASPNEPTTPQIPQQIELIIKDPKEIFNKKPNLISRLVELLGHTNQSIQLICLQILLSLAKASQKLKITICHYPGLVRHLINLLTHKPAGENAEVSKRAATLLSRLSKESYNISILLPYETILAQVALTDNPHSDVITDILVRLEINSEK
ncbi:hypothetical protein DICPUDRAFT_99722 [Dictyostelium purpureum]|uniref:Uncharacterized protein n=1 Tax=Dictyostelium purpureum TaxID=5786 RepID=F1A1U5_DICPU|nr:uncharacterized protein DICPUDRAFT_99722 [Dictyostelium purpureum]EGC29838.1 hypothetical protein DICPUDRAFT_99722 [Dictyostelium purpureum]|eukprot:XP_003293636.1 hypothetical protein DICPUDRAFT_99722 [Dictyostelium purpureum]